MKRRALPAPLALPPQEDWRAAAYTELRNLIREEVEEHQPRQNGAHVGDDNFAQTWWCSVCSTRWPCRFIRWARQASGNDNELLPLRSVIKGEQVTPDGRGVTLSDGCWMAVDGLEPPAETS